MHVLLEHRIWQCLGQGESNISKQCPRLQGLKRGLVAMLYVVISRSSTDACSFDVSMRT
jgi:hypothetical protein